MPRKQAKKRIVSLINQGIVETSNEHSEVESDFMSYITNSNLHSVISKCVIMCFESGAQNPGRFLRDYFSKSSDQENTFLREEIKNLKSQIKQLKLRPNFESPTNLLEENMRLKEDSESLKSQIILMDQQIIDSDNEKTLIDKKIDSQNQPKIQQKRSRIDKGQIKKRSATRKGFSCGSPQCSLRRSTRNASSQKFSMHQKFSGEAQMVSSTDDERAN